MSNQISNYPYPYSFFGLLFQSVICFLVLVFLQALIRLQNIHRTSNTTQTVSADNQLKANSNPNQQEPSSQISEDSVPVGAKGTYSQTMIEDRHALSEPRFLPPATPQAELLRRRGNNASPLALELIKEGQHEIMSLLSDGLASLGLHHVLDVQQLLVAAWYRNTHAR